MLEGFTCPCQLDLSFMLLISQPFLHGLLIVFRLHCSVLEQQQCNGTVFAILLWQFKFSAEHIPYNKQPRLLQILQQVDLLMFLMCLSTVRQC